MTDRKPILVFLVGPNGAGKTSVARAMERGDEVRFVDVLSIANRVFASMATDEHDMQRGFEAIQGEIDALGRAHPVLVTETNGTSAESQAFNDTIAAQFDVVMIRLVASPEVCAARLLARDPSTPVSAELLRDMHAATMALEWPFAMTIDNDGSRSVAEIAAQIAPLLDR